jgi:hypothetical protein
MFTLRPIIGKGFGLTATQRIPRGQRILTDKPLLSIPFADVFGGTRELLRKTWTLPAAEREELLSLSVNHDKTRSPLRLLETLWLSKSAPTKLTANHAIINVFRNNCFHIGDGVRAVFPQAARLNHACVPNAQGNFHSGLGAFAVHAVKEIAEEEEITISYLEVRGIYGDEYTCGHVLMVA